MKILISIFVILMCGSAFAADMDELIKLGAGYHAKNMCTCLFVVGQTEEFCKDMAKTSPNINELGGKYLIDTDKKTVIAKVAFVRATATMKDERLGCLLTPADAAE